jgi:plastocyanin
MWKQVFIALAMVGVVAATACKSGGTKAQVFAVQVDGKTAAFVATFSAYFPNEVQAHPGDTVQFNSVFTGEPHTVTLGKDVDALFALIAKACPSGVGAPPCDQGPPAQYAAQADALNAKLPTLLPNGPGDAVQTAVQPCFLATGDAPSDGSACTAAQMRPQPAFDGRQTYYNSGYLPDQAVFSVKLGANIAPGTYHYLCLLHREGMAGTITVVAKATKVATPAEVTKKGTDELAALAAKIKPAFDPLASLTADTAQAGAGVQGIFAGVNEFGPKEISIPVGGSVTWTIQGIHSISFNAPADAEPVLVKSADGSYHVNAKGPAPAGGPGQPTPDPNAPPPDPNAPPTVIDAGAWDGQGFHSSGFIQAFGPPTVQYKLTFTKAGTYKYDCLIHPNMEGTVKVGP